MLSSRVNRNEVKRELLGDIISVMGFEEESRGLVEVCKASGNFVFCNLKILKIY